jgi:hypothetical protein
MALGIISLVLIHEARLDEECLQRRTITYIVLAGVSAHRKLLLMPG